VQRFDSSRGRGLLIWHGSPFDLLPTIAQLLSEVFDALAFCGTPIVVP
jgi:hypothetical protein